MEMNDIACLALQDSDFSIVRLGAYELAADFLDAFDDGVFFMGKDGAVFHGHKRSAIGSNVASLEGFLRPLRPAM